jgi:hypothetical protein
LTITSSTCASVTVGQPVEALLGEPPAPLADHRPMHPEPLGDLGVVAPVGGQQHDPRAQRERLRAGPTPRPGLQLDALVVGQLDPNRRSDRHASCLPQPEPN